MKPTRVFSLVLAAAALSACTISPIVLGPAQGGAARPVGGNPGGAGLISNAPAVTTVTGVVTAPPAYGPLGGDPFAASAGLIAAGGQNLIAAGGMNYRLQQGAPLGDEDYLPLRGSEVYLADGEGNPLPGIRPALTNERGEFRFPGVPEGFTYLVVARARNQAGKPVQFKTLVRGQDGRGDVDPATTLATEAITEGAGRDLGQLDPERFRQVRETIREDLARDGLPDLADKEAVKARIGQLKAQYADLREAVDGLRSALQDAQATIDQLREELAARPLPSALPVAEPAPLTCHEAFKLRDKDDDGAVDFDEAGRPERFKELDRNGDGKLTPEEVCDIPLPKPLPKPLPLDCKERFLQLDQNGDKLVEIQEYPEGLPGQAGHPAFLALDANGDGKLTPEEFCGKPDVVVDPAPCDVAFKRADTDGDGYLDLEQAARLLPIVNKIAIDEPGVQRLVPIEDPLAVVKRLDRNQDGRLSLPEFCERPDLVIDPAPCEGVFSRMDLDGDGIVTYEEAAKLDQRETGDSNVRFLKARDQDGDQRLTRVEACPDGDVLVPASPLPTVRPPIAPLSCDERFRKEAGSDGVISYAEAKQAGWAADFQKADRNGDQVVGRREFGWVFCDEPMPEPMPNPCDEKFRYSAGDDAAITPDEAAALGWTKDQFYKYDVDGSGRVDRVEWGQAMCDEVVRIQPVLERTTATTDNLRSF